MDTIRQAQNDAKSGSFQREETGITNPPRLLRTGQANHSRTLTLLMQCCSTHRNWVSSVHEALRSSRVSLKVIGAHFHASQTAMQAQIAQASFGADLDCGVFFRRGPAMSRRFRSPTLSARLEVSTESKSCPSGRPQSQQEIASISQSRTLIFTRAAHS